MSYVKVTIVGLTEKPSLVLYRNSLFATQGLYYDWPESWRSGNQITLPASMFGSSRDSPHTINLFDGYVLLGNGTVYVLTRQSTINMKSREKRNIRRLAGSRMYADFLHNLVMTHWSNDLLSHQLPQINGKILSECILSYRTKSLRRVRESVSKIRKLAYQSRSILQGQKVLEGSWQPDKSESVGIYSQIEQCINSLDLDFSERNIEVSMLGKNYCRWRMSYEDFETVFVNVFINVSKYTVRDSTVHVSFEEGLNGLSISISMHSAVIHDHERDRVFELGYRGIAGTQLDRGGTGIGLFVVREILMGYGAQIEVLTSPSGRADCSFNVFKIFIHNLDLETTSHA